MLRELTVAQLAEQIEERGLELPKGKKKENFVLAASTLTAEEVKTYDEYIEKQLQVNEETVANNSQEMEDIANKRKKLFSYKKTVILPQESEVEELTFDNLFEDDVEAQYFLLKKEQEEAERLAVEAAEVEEVTEETQYEEVESDEESEETNLGGDLDE